MARQVSTPLEQHNQGAIVKNLSDSLREVMSSSPFSSSLGRHAFARQDGSTKRTTRSSPGRSKRSGTTRMKQTPSPPEYRETRNGAKVTRAARQVPSANRPHRQLPNSSTPAFGQSKQRVGGWRSFKWDHGPTSKIEAGVYCVSPALRTRAQATVQFGGTLTAVASLGGEPGLPTPRSGDHHRRRREKNDLRSPLALP